MLSPAEADLTLRDATLPGLATVLDPEAFLAALSRAAPGCEPGNARIDYVKYSPENYCRVAYRIDVAGTECELDARAFRPEEFDSWLEDEEQDAAVAGPLGAGRIVLRDRAVLVNVFPNDVKLRQLRDLTDRERRRPLLSELLPDHPALGAGELRGLRYWPGRRYSAELRAADGSRALIKAYTKRGYRRARRNAELFRSRPPLRVARPIGTSDDHRLIAFEWLPGRMLSDLCLAPEIGWEAVRRTGEALAALHAQDAEWLEPWTRADETSYFASLAREIGFIHPPLAGLAESVARQVTSRLSGAPDWHRPLHSDFSDTQVLIDGRDVAIVDLDSARSGDPADDLGSLLAQEESYALRGKLPRDRVDGIQTALLEGYRRAESGMVLERVGPYTAAGLLRRARFAFRTRKADCAQIVETFLRRADEIMHTRD